MSAQTLKPLSRVSLAEHAAAQLRQAIVAGEFPPGAPLAEPMLAERLGISRAPVREALISLEQQGLIVFDARGRTRVRSLQLSDLEEICTLRGALESLAARLVCRRWNEELEAASEQLLRAQQAARTWSDLSQLDADLHEALLCAAGHERLLAAWRPLRAQLEMWLVQAFQAQAKLGKQPREETVQSHRRLIDALRSGDEPQAARLAEEHVTDWRRLFSNSWT
jgi:DNA-binding GntR family transcriptional regulator